MSSLGWRGNRHAPPGSLGTRAARGWKKTLHAFLALGLATGLSLVIAEAVLYLIQPTSKQYLAIAPNVRVVFTPKYAGGIHGPSVYEVNSLGARGHEHAADRSLELRILAIGGSTTECLQVDQSRVWTTLLENRLQGKIDDRSVCVENIGKSGLNSRHHVLQVQHLEAYDPDIVVLLVGINDLSTRLGADVNYDPWYVAKVENQIELLHQAFAVFPNQTMTVHYPDDPWIKQTRIWGLLRTVRYSRSETAFAQDPEGEHLRNWRELRAAGRRRDELPGLDEALDEYERNLTFIIDYVRSHGTRLLLMTQPTLWRSDLTPEESALLWMGGVGEFQAVPNCEYYEAGDLAEAMKAYNERLLAVCREHHVRCVDLANLMAKTPEYFYDDCHFTDKANELIAELAAPAIIDLQAEARTLF